MLMPVSLAPLRRVAAASLAALVLALAAGPADSSTYPSRPIRIVLGPTPEALPRLVADLLREELGQPVIVESRPGAGGEIAATAVATAEPDGYTLLWASSNFTLSTAMQLGRFHLAKDFSPISQMSITPYLLVVHPSVAANTPAELVALAKQHGQALNCASSGMATPGHLGCEMLNAMADIRLAHVPYRNAGSAMTGLLAGEAQVSFMVSVTARPQVRAGALKALAITTPEADPLFPKLVPLNKEPGFAGFIITGWGSVVAPARTPRAVVDRLNAALNRVIENPKFRDRLHGLGQQPGPGYSPAEFTDFINSEIDRWNKTIDLAGVERGRR